MTDTQKLIAGGASLLLIGFAIGRFYQPSSVKTTEQVVTHEEKKTETDTKTRTERDKNKTLVTVETDKPDGTKRIVTRLVENTQTNRNTDTTVKQEEKKDTAVTKTTDTEYKKADTSLAFLAGTNIKTVFSSSAAPLMYGGHVQRRLIGPFSVGVWGLSSGAGGASVGISF